MPNFVVLTFAPPRKEADGIQIRDCAGKKKIAVLKVFRRFIWASTNGTDCVIREAFRFRFRLDWGLPLNCRLG